MLSIGCHTHACRGHVFTYVFISPFINFWSYRTHSTQERQQMAKISLSVTHDLGREEALQRLQNESDMLKRTFGDSVSDLQENWADTTLDFSLVAYGMTVSGDVLVDTAEVVTNIKLPMAALMFKGTIESRVRERLEKLLA